MIGVLSKYKANKIVGKEDFFHLPFFFNSPTVMLDSLLKLPNTVHDSCRQIIVLEEEFGKTEMYYREIEKGFWILSSDLHVMGNLHTNLVFDKSKLSEYYLLTFTVVKQRISYKKLENLELFSSYWTFSTPNTEISTFYYDEHSYDVFSFAIKKDWAVKQLSSKYFNNRKAILNFFNGKRRFHSSIKTISKTTDIFSEIKEILRNDPVQTSRAKLKKKGMNIIVNFFENSLTEERMLQNVQLSNEEYRNVAKAEKLIMTNLQHPFIGIEFITKEVHTSPTKLKANFKLVFGFTMLQYHKEKNLLVALQLIKMSNIRIYDIAILTGYDSATRFSMSFKKRFGKLPSEFRLKKE